MAEGYYCSKCDKFVLATKGEFFHPDAGRKTCYKCARCGKEEEKYSGFYNDDKRCSGCGKLMHRLFSTSVVPLLNRSKPTGLKWHSGEMNPNKDRLKALQNQDEKLGNLTPLQISEVKRLRKKLNIV